MRFRHSVLGLTALALALGLCAPPAVAKIAYETRFTGIGDALQAELRAVSQLVALAKRKPASDAALRQRAASDMGRLKAVLASQGYYDASADFALDGTTSPATVTVSILPGARYRLRAVHIVNPAGAAPPDPSLLRLDRLGLRLGQPALAAPVIDAEAPLLAQYTDNGWPLARIVSRRTVIDTATKTMDVTYVLDAGPKARFGAIEIEGLKRLHPGYVLRRIAWMRGRTYDQRLVDRTRDKLIASGLFGAVVVQPAPAVAADGEVPMRLRLTERALHTLTAGISYDTSLGLEATFGWEHRDLFGHGEDLKATATVGQSDNGVQLNFRRPDIGRIDQDFLANIGFDNALEDAFRSISQQASIGLERHFDQRISGTVSLLAQHARINEIVDYRVYTLVGVPVTLADDQSDNPLNPSRGYRLNVTATPYFRALGSNLTYAQGLVTTTRYVALDPGNAYILALEGQLGATGGTSLQSIPKDHRFFGGGGGSVRGFGYQKAGPLDIYDNPIGGRSLAVASLELRIRLSSTIGLVPFYDAGSDYASALPDFSGTLYQGAGLGLRYYSPIGPIRLDLATPINPRPEDSPIQVYISIGQAF